MELTKARKEHCCEFCGETIPAGTLYHYEALTPWSHWINETFGSWKVHRVCWAFWMAEYGDPEDYIWGGEVSRFKREMAFAIARRIFKHIAKQQPQPKGSPNEQ